MNSFELVNWIALVASWSAIVIQISHLEKSRLILMLGFAMLLAPFAPVAKISVLANVGTLLCSLTVLTSKKWVASVRAKLSLRLNVLSIFFLATLFFLPIVLRDNQGWLIILGVASKYWFLFSIAVLFSFNRENFPVMVAITIVSLTAGIIWRFKIAFVFFAFMAIYIALTRRSLKWTIILGVGIITTSAVTYSMFLEEFLSFLASSVLRTEYSGDQKILGFSDGARLMIWSHYIENSIWFGRGGYYLPDTIPTHNIIVYLVHELGIVGALIFGPFLVYFAVMIARRIGAILAFLLFLSFSLSSIGEYPSMWAYCIIFAPLTLRAAMFHMPVVLFRNARHG